MKTVYQKICDEVGMLVIGEDVAKSAVTELLGCIGRDKNYAERYPKRAASEIIAYFDNIERNP